MVSARYLQGKCQRDLILVISEGITHEIFVLCHQKDPRNTSLAPQIVPALRSLDRNGRQSTIEIKVEDQQRCIERRESWIFFAQLRHKCSYKSFLCRHKGKPTRSFIPLSAAEANNEFFMSCQTEISPQLNTSWSAKFLYRSFILWRKG